MKEVRPRQHMTALEVVITEICYAACVKVMGATMPITQIAQSAEALSEMLVELVVSQGNDPKPRLVDFGQTIKGYGAFELTCRTLDEIEKQIPVASMVNCICTVTRTARKKCLDEFGTA